MPDQDQLVSEIAYHAAQGDVARMHELLEQLETMSDMEIDDEHPQG